MAILNQANPQIKKIMVQTTYETYKPSGIEWIGDVPEEWEIKRLKDVLEEKLMYGANEVGDDEDESNPRYIRITDFDENGELRSDTFKSLPLNIAKDYLLKSGDILFARSGATVGKTFQFKNYNGLACFAGYLIKASPNETRITSDYLFYYTQCEAYENWKNSIFNKATIENIGADKYQFLKVTIPPKSEQLAIANYLDDQTQKIDRLIANKKAQAEKLKELRQIEINNAVTKGLNPNAEMKDSGIEWMRKIPENWKVKRIKDVASVRGRIGFRGYTVDDIVEEGALVIGAKHLNSSNQLNFQDPEYISWEKYYESPEIMVQVGDVLIVQRGSVGKFALVENEIGPATINPSMILLRLNSRVYPKFLFWFSLGEYFFNVIKTIVSSTAVPMISQMQAGVFRVLLPPIEEQIEIANYLQDRITAIDQLIKNIEAQIEKLQELRKIKIYEAVTGKIKV
ncbi:MAG: restriction endonuclease subunit S [Bacteroidia bacterium]|nr:restriction endonuclease subunit S [Bacteroidia bacterium]